MAQPELVGAKSGGYKTIVYIICSVAALGGLLFGLDQGFVANSLDTIQQHYHLGVEGGEHIRCVLIRAVRGDGLATHGLGKSSR